MPVVLLKYGPWGAAGVLIGIAVAIWARPETGAGFMVIIAVCLLASIVARGVVHGALAVLRPSADESEDGEDSEEEGDKTEDGEKGAGDEDTAAKDDGVDDEESDRTRD